MTQPTYGLGLCSTGKYRYDSVHAAQRAANECGRKHSPRRAYRCPECHGWHLTSALARRSR